ncbi:MAG: hydrogenase maturation protease [Pseudonocardiaceae bacterium]
MTTTMVAGLGNLFNSDDAFGVELARRLTKETLPEGVKVADYGVRFRDLAYDLREMAPDTTILLDAVSPRDKPGKIHVLEISSGDVPGIEPSAVDGHGMTIDAVLALLDNLGGSAGRTLLVGCEPASTEEGMGLSTTVAAAVDRAVTVVMDLLTDKEGSDKDVPSAASTDLLGVSDRPGHRSGAGI